MIIALQACVPDERKTELLLPVKPLALLKDAFCPLIRSVTSVVFVIGHWTELKTEDACLVSNSRIANSLRERKGVSYLDDRVSVTPRGEDRCRLRFHCRDRRAHV